MAETSNPFFARNKITEQGIIPSRGGGGPRVRGPAQPSADYYEDLRAQQRGRNAPESEPGPYGSPADPYLNRGPIEAPTEFAGERYHGMAGERLSFFQRPEGWYAMPNNPEADPVGPFPSMHEAASYFAPRGNQ